MILAILTTLLILNIIGVFNRKKIWSKVFFVSQLLFFVGAGIIFILNDTYSPMQSNVKTKKIEQIVNTQKEKADTMEMEKEANDGLKVKFK